MIVGDRHVGTSPDVPTFQTPRMEGGCTISSQERNMSKGPVHVHRKLVRG